MKPDINIKLGKILNFKINKIEVTAERFPNPGNNPENRIKFVDFINLIK